MGSTTTTTTTYPAACDIGSEYVYQSHNQISSLPAHFPVNPVTPPESLASGVRDFGHEDVGRLQDVLEEDGEKFNNNGSELDVKDIVLLEETTSLPPPPPESASTSSVQMVNVRSNKISLCNDAETASSRGSFAAQMYLKEAMKDIFVNISNAFNTPELIVLEGANGAVAVHKSVISAYSALVKEQLAEYPDCTTIYLPNYSQKIIRKVVEILYTGETFYSEKEKKDVNLIWDAMRQLQISFSDKSFYYHPVEYTAVKEEGEEEQHSSQQSAVPPTQDQLEVDHTEDIWHEDQSNISKPDNAHSYCRTIRQPHPENPAKSVYVHSQYGEGRKIQRGLPALSHVNDDEIKEKERVENQRQVERILSRHKPIVIDLLDDDDDVEERCSPKKRGRTAQPHASGTTVLRDEAFKNLVASGKVTLNMVKAATSAVQQHHGETSRNQTGVDQHVVNDCHTLQPLSAPEAAEMSCVAPSAIPLVQPVRVTSVVIPPNRPEGTGITFLLKGPANGKESNGTLVLQPTGEMPILRPNRKLRERKKSSDIIDIPRLDKMNQHGQERTSIRNIEMDSSSCKNTESSSPTSLAAAIIPGGKVNQFVNSQQSQHSPSSSGSSSSPTLYDNEAERRRMRKRKLDDALMMQSPENGQELQRLREVYQQEQQQQKNNVIVLGSTKKPVPENVKVDAYVENMEEPEDDDDLVFNDMNNWFVITGGHTVRNGKRGGSSKSARGRGRPRQTKPANTEVFSEDKGKSMTGPTKRRGRGGGRRGVRSACDSS